MAIDEEDIKAFLVESYENLNDIEQDIIALENHPDHQEFLVRIYRSVHSIKGNCGFLTFPKLESVAHLSENLLGRLRDRSLALNPEITSALLQTVDAIRQLLNNIETTGHEGESDYSELIKTFSEILRNPVSLTKRVSRQEPTEALTLAQADTSIRVNVSLLDQLMNLVGELVLARNQIVQFSQAQENTAFTATSQRLNLITSELQSGVMKTRMQPISILWQKFARVTRDLALTCGKQVRLEMEGAETELDKTIIEAIGDPLTHLVRNCIDHGIETQAARIEAGKPPEGRLSLRAFHESGKVNIEISDDGAGIDLERIKQLSQQRGLISAAQAAEMSELEAINLIFLPGFSTAKQVTNISGRGVGMDVVKTNIEKINGTVEVYTQLGQGTTFKIKIPLTLAIIPALIVTGAGDRYAIPQGSLLELVRLEGEQARQSIEILYDVPVYRLRENLLPLVYLNHELQLEDTVRGSIDEEIINIVVLQADEYSFGLVVDAIDDTQEIVVKSLGKQLKNISMFAGATILGDGKVALIIDVMGLAYRARLISEMRDRLSNTKTQEIQYQEDTCQMLLFTGPEGGRMAIPLSAAARLEEFPQSVVERMGNQYVVQYRGKILSLITLSSIFSVHNQHQQLTEASDPMTCNDTIQVIVISVDLEHNVGIVVNRILDIVEEQLTIKSTTSRQGVLFSTVIQGHVTEILDIENVIKITNPLLHSQAGAWERASLRLGTS